FNLVYKGSNTHRVAIRIVDANNRTVFVETIKKHDAFARPYNFSNLPEGVYTVEVTDANGTTIAQIENFETIEGKTIAYPTLVKFDNIELDKYRLTIVNDGYKRADINVYDNNENLIFNTTEDINGSYSKLYNLKRVNAAKIEVIVAGETKTFEL
ncbi:hypothetical protein, partial [Fulvivirga aurantia]|uniref:hypothetical protein n=1 Tax=Fulvivirga aurantia TaxID=2529383 RepID=UPI001625D92A